MKLGFSLWVSNTFKFANLNLEQLFDLHKNIERVFTCDISSFFFDDFEIFKFTPNFTNSNVKLVYKINEVHRFGLRNFTVSSNNCWSLHNLQATWILL